MPRRPRRGCAYGWCMRLAVDGEQYCEDHLNKVNRDYERYGRDPKTKRMYKGSWEKIRKAYAMSRPFCEECVKEGNMVINLESKMLSFFMCAILSTKRREGESKSSEELFGGNGAGYRTQKLEFKQGIKGVE